MNRQSNRTPTWLVYERCVAAFTLKEHDDVEVTVQPNVKLIGHLSGTERQIDVLIDSRWNDGINRRIIVDAKEWKRKIDVKDVESFEGMMRDCQANRGVIVTTKGFSEAALRRAQDAITITILTLGDLEEYEWVYEPCYDECRRNTGKYSQRGMVLWATCLLLPYSEMAHIIQTGKCDGCHSFHVWCWECGLKFAVPDYRLVTCDCGHHWVSWLYNDEGTDRQSMNLMLRLDDEFGLILDRRAVR
jgi:hypothetical protein